MGPEDVHVTASAFSDKIPPSFDGRSNYASYREDVILWKNLTSLAESKQGPALIGRLSGEAKASAKSLPLEVICTEHGVEEILQRLDKSYAVDAANQLDTDLANFLDYSWKKSSSVEQYIAGFHSRLDKLASLELDCKLKGHLLLRQAQLQNNEKNMVIGAASGNYDVQNLTTALRNAYIHSAPTSDSTLNTEHDRMNTAPNRPQVPQDQKFNNGDRRNDRPNHDRQSPKANTGPSRPTFYTYKTSSPPINMTGAVLDSGACASIVGKTTLDKALADMKLSGIPDATPARENHRFGDNPEEHPTICAVKFPFACRDDNDQHLSQFDIQFDVIDGALPFLIGLPSLMAMRSCLNFKFKTLGLSVGTKYLRIPLSQRDSHLFLPFSTTIKRLERENSGNHSRSGSQYTQLATPGVSISHYQPSDEPAQVVHNPTPGHFYLAPTSSSPPACSKARSIPPPIPPTQYTPSSYISKYRSTPTTAPPCERLSAKDIFKLHIQLKHASAHQLRRYLEVADLWSSDQMPTLTTAIAQCKCRLASPPLPHSVASATPPGEAIQAHLAIDVIHLENKKFLHCLDRHTGWSEVGLIQHRDLAEQVRVFRHIQVNRHGVPRSVLCDREFNKGDFAAYCTNMLIQLTPVAAHSHESNGAIERANRSLRSRFDRLRLCDKRSPLCDIVSEATFAKNINPGTRLVSAFELLYSRPPRTSGESDTHSGPIPSMHEHASHVARQRVRTMLRSNVRNPTPPIIGEEVYFWRDNEGWVGPSTVQAVTSHGVSVLHNGHTKTSSLNRIRSIHATPPSDDPTLDKQSGVDAYSQTPIDHDTDSDDDTSTSDRQISTAHIHDPAVTPAPDQPIEQQHDEDAPDDVRQDPVIVSKTRQPIRDSEIRLLREESEAFLKDLNPLSARNQRQKYPTNNNPDPSPSPATRASTHLTFPHGYPNTGDDAWHFTTAMNVTTDEKEQAYIREFKSWQSEEAFVRVDRSSVSRDANIIGSHTVYSRKDDGRVKARIVPWGHRDAERHELRNDSPCVNLEVFRIVLSLAAEHKWVLGQMDISTAFLQALGFNREIYVIPPKEAIDSRGLWKLTAAAYGLVDSGRLWYRTSDHALVDEYNLQRSRFEPTLYFIHKDGKLVFALVAQVDNYIYAGNESEVKDFEKFLQKRFHVGTLDRHKFSVMGCELEQHETGSILLTQRARFGEIDDARLTTISPHNTRPADRPATKDEIHTYRSVIGKMLYIGRMSQPIMLYHASHMATKINDLQKHHLKDLAALLRYDKKQVPTLRYVSPSIKGQFDLEAISDASMSKVDEGGARGAHIIFRRLGDITHPILWSAKKMRRVSRSSSTAELLAATDAVSALTYLQCLLSELTYKHKGYMFVDNRALANLATSIREPAEKENKIDLAYLRERFIPEGISGFGWIPGHYNISDGMTKDNRTTAALLTNALREGTHPRHPDTLTQYAEHPLMAEFHPLAINDAEPFDGLPQKGGV